jgi:hypothetical protein
LAIKGKRRTKNRPVTRAPRRAPVAVKPHLFGRRWFQLTALFVAGIFATMFVVWVTNGLREERASDADAAAKGRTRRAVQTWQTTVEGEVAKVGSVGGQGIPPTLFPQITGLTDDLAKGKAPPKDAETALASARKGAVAAADAIDAFKLTDAIRKANGFVVAQTNYLLNSQSRLVDGLHLYQHAIEVAVRAVAATGAERARLGAIAVALRDQAAQVFADGWNDLENVKASVGLGQIPTVTP